MAEVEVRTAVPSDLAGMLRLLEQLAAQHAAIDPFFQPGDDWRELMETMLIDRLGRADHWVAVATVESRVVGLVTASLRSSPAYQYGPRVLVENLVVEASCRRQGVGRELVRAVWRWALARQVVYVELTVAAANDSARAFWQACGFEPVTLHLQRRASEVDLQ